MMRLVTSGEPGLVCWMVEDPFTCTWKWPSSMGMAETIPVEVKPFQTIYYISRIGMRKMKLYVPIQRFLRNLVVTW